MPSFLKSKPVGECDLKSQICPIQFRTDGQDGKLEFIGFDDFTRLIEQFPGICELHLQGFGEPIMHPRFFDMVKFAKVRGIKVTTNSNLTSFTKRRAEAVVASGLDTIHISVDGATKKTYEAIRVGSNFEKVISNIKLLNLAKRDLDADTPNLRLVFGLMRLNLHELPTLVRLAARLYVSEVIIQHLCRDFQESPPAEKCKRDFLNKQTLLVEDRDRVDFYFDAARDIANSIGIDLRLPSVGATTF